MNRINRNIKPKVGKKYRAKVNGFDAVLEYQGQGRKKNHCVTCTCEDKSEQYNLIFDANNAYPNIGAGSYAKGDIELIEEISENS